MTKYVFTKARRAALKKAQRASKGGHHKSTSRKKSHGRSQRNQGGVVTLL